jgi:hypothetical protein
MNPAFIAVVADTLLPGDSGGGAGKPPLPPASAAGIDLAAIAQPHRAVFDAIATQSNGVGAFTAGTDAARIAAIQAIERAMPDAFRALLSALLADYYESPPVLSAMGWRTEPPQPQGHAMPKLGDAAFKRLDRVRARGKLWRN